MRAVADYYSNREGNMEAFSVGEAVWASFKGEEPVIAFVSGPTEATDDNEVKTRVQAPDGSHHLLGYREPEDRDARGYGGTFWTI